MLTFYGDIALRLVSIEEILFIIKVPNFQEKLEKCMNWKNKIFEKNSTSNLIMVWSSMKLQTAHIWYEAFPSNIHDFMTSKIWWAWAANPRCKFLRKFLHDHKPDHRNLEEVIGFFGNSEPDTRLLHQTFAVYRLLIVAFDFMR